MLKIKDNVDLKELEKFGFDMEQTKDEFDQIYHFDSGLSFDKDYRTLSIPMYYCMEDEPYDTLYDLIQAGLVEKVVE